MHIHRCKHGNSHDSNRCVVVEHASIYWLMWTGDWCVYPVIIEWWKMFSKNHLKIFNYPSMLLTPSKKICSAGYTRLVLIHSMWSRSGMGNNAPKKDQHYGDERRNLCLRPPVWKQTCSAAVQTVVQALSITFLLCCFSHQNVFGKSLLHFKFWSTSSSTI